MGVLTGRTRTLPRLSCRLLAIIYDQSAMIAPCKYLFETASIEQEPAHLNHLGRVLCDIDAMLIAGSRNVKDDITLTTSSLGCSHFGRLIGR